MGFRTTHAVIMLRRVIPSDLRLCHAAYYHHCSPLIHSRAHYKTGYLTSQRSFSFQSSIESLARTQSGIFQKISESYPVECCQNLLLDIHDYTGLPWWASIMCTTILLRSIITVPLAVYQNNILARLENIKYEMNGIVEEMKKETTAAVHVFKWDEKTARAIYNRSLKKQWNNLIVRENCHPFKTTLLFLVQIPLWVSVSVSLRNLVYMLPHGDLTAQIAFTQLSVGGFGWIHNLILPDATFILPICFGLTNLCIIELQTMSKVRVPTKLQRYMTNMFRGLSICMIPVAASVPSCLVLYWTTSSVFGLIQNLILMSPKTKRICRIPQTPSELEQPYKQVGNALRERLKFIGFKT